MAGFSGFTVWWMEKRRGVFFYISDEILQEVSKGILSRNVLGRRTSFSFRLRSRISISRKMSHGGSSSGTVIADIVGPSQKQLKSSLLSNGKTKSLETTTSCTF